MNGQVGFFAITAGFALGCYGWGWGTLALADRWAPKDTGSLNDEFGGAFRITVGVAAYLVFSGVAIAADLGYFPVLVAWLGLGAVLALARAVWAARRGSLGPGISTVVSSTAFLAVAWLAYGTAVSGALNANDDDPGYVYLADRLLGTGGLIDPFNLRRITAYGGGEAIEALVVKASSPAAALGVEWFLFLLLTLALFVRRSTRPGAALVVAAVGYLFAIAHPVGVWANSGPTFSGVALTLALLQLLAGRSDQSPTWPRLVIAGLLVGGLLALRFEFVVPAIVAVVASLARYGWRAGARATTITAAAAIASVMGWAVALERSSSTPIFPFIAGTYNATFPWADPGFHGFVHWMLRLRAEVATNCWGYEMLAVIGAFAVLHVASTRLGLSKDYRGTAFTLAGVLVGCAALLVYETRSLSGGVLLDVGRYNAPSALAVVLFTADALWQLAVEARAADEARTPRTDRSRDRFAAWACGSVAAVCVAVATLPQLPDLASYHGRLATTRTTTTLALRDTYDRLAHGLYNPWGPYELGYERINAAISPGSNLLAAVNLPGLLDFSKYRFATLDIPGTASPAPGIPLGSGASAVESYLRGLGYDGVVASVTSAPGLYRYRSWVANTSSGVEDYRAMASNFIEWTHDLSELAHLSGITHVRIGSLEYLSWSRH